MARNISAIIVTHNSEEVIERSVGDLLAQNYPINGLIIVDSGSDDISYLENFSSNDSVTILHRDNVGFAKANNIGFAALPQKTDYVLLLNPDTFLHDNFLKRAVDIMEEHDEIGVLSGRLLEFDYKKNKSTGKIDSTGIFRKFYGRWYDRGRNEADSGQFLLNQEVPALCGALMFCRVNALESLGSHVFDPDFFLYKEDIEISIRLKKKGWKLLYSPELSAYHCRGWQKRNTMDYRFKRIAAENEILLYKKHPSPYIFWAYLKYWLVLTLRI